MKILIYCQNVLGVGHLSRALNISKSLASEHQVTMIQGGPNVAMTCDHPNFQHHYLEPLLMDVQGVLYSPSLNTVQSVWAKRKSELELLANQSADILIVEFFPFGRYQFKDEILALIDSLKRVNPSLKVVCSMRDIYTHKPDKTKFKKRSLYCKDTLNSHFDHLLIHSDQDFVGLDSSFPYTHEITIPTSYTGIIAPEKISAENKHDSEVVISMGGGSWGESLHQSVRDAAKELPGYHFSIFHSALGAESKTSSELENVTELAFDPRLFKFYLARARYSIGLAGYNTVAEALLYQTTMILYPFELNNEQPARVAALKARNLCHALSPKTDLKSQLVELFQNPCAITDFSMAPKLNGCEQTLNIINQLSYS